MVIQHDKRPILVVDDEPDMLNSLRGLLRYDFKVYTAGSGAEGVALLQQQEIHVVMTDQRMPQMTGVDFLRQIKSEYPEAIRVIFTGYADLNAIIDAINLGNVYRYVSKPWEPEQLIATLREAGEQHDLILERRRLLEDLKTNEEGWMALEAELEEGRAGLLSPAATEQREMLNQTGRELLKRLGTMLARLPRGVA